jgi:hypothetical protein
MSVRIQAGTDYEQVAVVAAAGLSMKIEVRRASDGNYWSGSGWAATPPVTPLAMTEDINPAAGSLYWYNLDTDHASWSYEGQIQLIAYAGTTVYGTGTLHVGEWVDDVDSAADVVTALRAWAVETGQTFEEVMQRAYAVLVGVTSKVGDERTFDAGGNPGTTRVTATVDAQGNRSNVTLS